MEIRRRGRATSACNARHWIMRRFSRVFCGSIRISGRISTVFGLGICIARSVGKFGEGAGTHMPSLTLRVLFRAHLQREVAVGVAEGVGDTDVVGGVFVSDEND